MRAFRNYRLLGSSDLVAKIDYTWPVWVGFDAVAEVAGRRPSSSATSLAGQYSKPLPPMNSRMTEVGGTWSG